MTTGEVAFDDFKLDGTGSWIGGLPALVTGNAFAAMSASESMICLLDPQSIGIADAGTATLDVSTRAALQMDTSPTNAAATLTSLLQSDLVAVKLSRYVSWALLRAAGAVTIRGINL